MQWLTEASVVVALFVIRLGVPLAIIFLVAYALRGLDMRWHMEALARRQQLFVANSTAPGALASPTAKSLIQEPCWEFRACPQELRDKCPAYLYPQLPCWIARRHTGGQLSSQCCNCSIFTTAKRVRAAVTA